MQLETLVGFYYTFIHIAPFDGLIFYAFRRHLRFGAMRTALGYFALLALEGTVQTQLTGVHDQRVSLLFQLIYLVYDLWAIRAYPSKVLAVGLLTAPPSLLSFSVATLAEKSWPMRIPDLAGGLMIALLFLVFLGPALYYIRHVLEPLLTIQEKKPWRYLAGYETTLIFIALLIDPFHKSTAPQVFIARGLLLAANIACVQIMAYLCQVIRSREYTRHLLNSVQALQNMEHQRYKTVMERWRASRRLRHDSHHYMVTIAALARARKGAELKAYLRSLAEGAGLRF